MMDKQQLSNEIFVAIRKGGLSRLKELLAEGAPVDLPAQNPPYKGCLPIHAAVRSGRDNALGMIKLLLEHGADIDAKAFDHEQTALAYAVERGEWRMFDALLDLGANPHLKDKEGFTAPDMNDNAQETFNTHCMNNQKFLESQLAKGVPLETMLFNKDGTFSLRAKLFAHANVMPEIFSHAKWKGKEGEAVALYEKLEAAMPEAVKAHVLPTIDITDLRLALIDESAPSAIERYVRRPKPGTPSEGRG